MAVNHNYETLITIAVQTKRWNTRDRWSSRNFQTILISRLAYEVQPYYETTLGTVYEASSPRRHKEGLHIHGCSGDSKVY